MPSFFPSFYRLRSWNLLCSWLWLPSLQSSASGSPKPNGPNQVDVLSSKQLRKRVFFPACEMRPGSVWLYIRDETSLWSDSAVVSDLAFHSGCEYKACGLFICASETLFLTSAPAAAALWTPFCFSVHKSLHLWFCTRPVFQKQWTFACCCFLLISFFFAFSVRNSASSIAAKRLNIFNPMYKRFTLQNWQQNKKNKQKRDAAVGPHRPSSVFLSFFFFLNTYR